LIGYQQFSAQDDMVFLLVQVLTSFDSSLHTRCSIGVGMDVCHSPLGEFPYQTAIPVRLALPRSQQIQILSSMARARVSTSTAS
jgi:hypothetical protein